MVITGTEDIAVPVANSLIIAQKIPGSWLIQIKGVGHGLMYQYPDKLSKVLQTFLTATTPWSHEYCQLYLLDIHMVSSDACI